MNIAIVGFDREGQASYQYFSNQNHQLTICDFKTDIEVPADCEKQLGPDYLRDLDRFDLIVRTPGLKPSDILAANPTVANKITSGTNLFFKDCPTRNIIGVTGTKGKGTTSTLIYQMLQAAGKKVHLAGNIGLPALSILSDIKSDDWVVLELSSFQLIDLQSSPTIAVCLMIVPEHLNWHADMAEYLAAKQNLFAHQTVSDTTIYFSQNPNSVNVASAGEGRMLPYFEEPGAHIEDDSIMIDGQTICKLNEVKLLGAHNWQNICAAITAVWQITSDAAALHSVITSFSGLEHRLELVRSVHGVTYYDDSFGTTPETAIVAIQAFQQTKVIILGGSDKGADFAKLARAVKDNDVRAVITIGETALAIQTVLEQVGFHHIYPGGTTMHEIVKAAKHQAHHGDVVLLSTACASFGLFADYKDRGNQFKSVVSSL